MDLTALREWLDAEQARRSQMNPQELQAEATRLRDEFTAASAAFTTAPSGDASLVDLARAAAAEAVSQWNTVAATNTSPLEEVAEAPAPEEPPAAPAADSSGDSETNVPEGAVTPTGDSSEAPTGNDDSADLTTGDVVVPDTPEGIMEPIAAGLNAADVANGDATGQRATDTTGNRPAAPMRASRSNPHGEPDRTMSPAEISSEILRTMSDPSAYIDGAGKLPIAAARRTGEFHLERNMSPTQMAQAIGWADDEGATVAPVRGAFCAQPSTDPERPVCVNDDRPVSELVRTGTIDDPNMAEVNVADPLTLEDIDDPTGQWDYCDPAQGDPPLDDDANDKPCPDGPDCSTFSKFMMYAFFTCYRVKNSTRLSDPAAIDRFERLVGAQASRRVERFALRQFFMRSYFITPPAAASNIGAIPYFYEEIAPVLSAAVDGPRASYDMSDAVAILPRIGMFGAELDSMSRSGVEAPSDGALERLLRALGITNFRFSQDMLLQSSVASPTDQFGFTGTEVTPPLTSYGSPGDGTTAPTPIAGVPWPDTIPVHIVWPDQWRRVVGPDYTIGVRRNLADARKQRSAVFNEEHVMMMQRACARDIYFEMPFNPTGCRAGVVDCGARAADLDSGVTPAARLAAAPEAPEGDAGKAEEAPAAAEAAPAEKTATKTTTKK